jgi:hypothetical protein
LDALDKAGQILLPAYFSDGYFTLLPKEKRTIVLESGNQQAVNKIQLSGYNINGLISIQ